MAVGNLIYDLRLTIYDGSAGGFPLQIIIRKSFRTDFTTKALRGGVAATKEKLTAETPRNAARSSDAVFRGRGGARAHEKDCISRSPFETSSPGGLSG